MLMWVFAGWAGGQTLTQDQQASPVPTLNFAPTQVPPLIDADLTDVCWKRSAVLGGFVRLDGLWSREQTEAFLTYDDTYVYIAVRCQESQVKSLGVHTFSHDAESICRPDAVEVYLDINRDRNSFYHLMVNPLGNVYEAVCDAKEGIRDVSWNPNCKIAVAVGQNEWTVELALPFASLGVSAPTPGTTWGFNLNRERVLSDAYSSWAMAKAFNKPRQFGRLIFGTADPISWSFLFARDSRGHAVTRTTIRNHANRSLPLHVETELSTGSSQPRQEITLAPQEEKQIELPCHVEAGNPKKLPTLTVRISDAANDTIYVQRTGLLETASPIILTPDRYYYPPDCDTFLADVTVRTGTSLQVSIKQTVVGDSLFEKTVPVLSDRSNYSVAIPAGDLSAGRYVITAAVLDADGNQQQASHRVVYKTQLPAPKPIPNPVTSISFRDDGVFIVNDKPFCPFLSSRSGTTPPRLADNVFNVNWGDFGLLPGALRRASVSFPFPTLKEKRTVYRVLGDDDSVKKALKKSIAEYTGDSQIFDWFISYEAQFPMYRDRERRIPLSNPQEFKKINDFIKSIDPNHPTSIQIDDMSQLHLYKDCTDMIEVASEASYADHLIPNLVDDVQTIRRVLGPAKPVLFYIGSTIPHESKRTPEEIRCAAYLALIHGLNGLVFHVGHSGINPTSTRHWSLYRGLAREIEFIYPILISPQSPELPGIATNSKDLQCRIKRYNHRTYLITCNTADVPITPTFTITGTGRYEQVTLPFEHRRIRLTDGVFSDEFMPYETHVYEVLETWNSGN